MIKTETKFVSLQIEPMLLKAEQLAMVLNVSKSHVLALDNAGKLPKAVSLGTSKRWSTQEIREWIASGCPDRITWMQRGVSRSKPK